MEEPRKDFFQVGGTLTEGAPSYIERSADTELLEALGRGELCLVLAPRQTGKSSLMIHARKRLKEKGVQSGVIDLQRLGKETNPDRFFESLMNQIVRTLELETDAVEWCKTRQGLSPTERFSSFIEDVVLAEVKGDVVLFFDEIDSILKLSFSDDFFTTVRSLVNARAVNPRLENLTFVFLGTTTKSSFIKDRSRTPFNIGTDIVLGDFDKSKTDSFKIVLGEDNDQLVDRIFYWTSGQPLLVQRLAAAAYSWPPKDRTTERLDEEATRSYLQQKIEQDTHLKFIRDYLLSDPAHVRKTLATYRDVLNGREVEENTQSPVHDRLKLAGVVKVEDHKLVPRNRIYTSIFNEQWVQEHTPANTQKFIAYAASLTLAAVLLWFFVFQPNIFPRFPSTDKIVKYTAEPSLDLELTVGDVSHAFLDGKEIPILNGVARTTLGSLAVGKESHTVKLVAGWFSKTREIPVEVIYYPRWAIRRFPDERVDSISPMLEIDGRTIKFRDVRDGRIVGTLEEGNANVTTAIWSPDRTRVLAGSENGVVTLWEVNQPENTFDRKLQGNPTARTSARNGAVRSVVFSADARMVAWGTDNGSLSALKLVAEIDGGTKSRKKTPNELLSSITTFNDQHGSISCMAFSPDNKTLASGNQDGTISVWNVQDGALLKMQSFMRHDGSVLGVAFGRDGKIVASGGGDKTVKLWNSETGQLLRTLVGHTGPVRSVAFSMTGNVLSGSDDRTVKYWNTVTGEVLQTLQTFDEELRIAGFPSEPDPRLIFAQGNRNTLRVWDFTTFKEIQINAGHSAEVGPIAFSPDGKKLVSAGTDTTIKLWDIESGQVLHTFTGHVSTVFGVAFSPDGKTLVSGAGDGTIKLWDIETGEVLRTFDVSISIVAAVAFSPDSRSIILGGSSFADRKGVVKLLDVETGQELRTFRALTDDLNSISVTADGKKIVSGGRLGDQAINVWDVDSGQLLRTFPGTAGFFGVVFSPDGKSVISAVNGEGPKLWDTESGRLLRTYTNGQGGGNGVAISPDGEYVISGGMDNTVILWNVSTGQELRRFTAHTAPILGVAYSPDGTMVVSGGFDRVLRLWWSAIEREPEKGQK